MTFGQTKEVRLSHLESADPFESLEIDVLFAQLGLFTIKSVAPDGFAVLGCPNQGAAISLEHLRDLAERRGLESSFAT